MKLIGSIPLLFALLLQAQTPPATFTGVFKGVESGRVVVEVESGNTMRLFVTGSTKFIRGGKKSKVSDFHDGEPVEVDGERDIRMNMVATRVELVKPKSGQEAR